MKTAGELLKEKRLKKDLNIQDIAEKTRVKQEYLEAIERNDFDNLPALTFTKGFLRSYAKELRINPDTVVAMFRRDFTENDSGHIVPKGLVNPVGNRTRSIPVNTLLSGIAIFSFLIFLGFQLIKYYSLPKIDLHQPVNGEVYTKKITIKGQVESDSVVTINNQKIIADPSGQFTLDLTYPAGTHSIVVQATNRQGKTKLIQRTFQVTQ